MSSNSVKGSRLSGATSQASAFAIPVALILIWLAVLAGVPAYLPLQLSSWLTFLALLITPGYLLAEMLTWRLNLDLLERFALAFPLGVAAMAVPGLTSMLLHLTMKELLVGWALTVSLIVIAWLVYSLWRRRTFLNRPAGRPWALDEIVMLLLLVAAFVYMFPLLMLYKIDGDSYAFIAFTRDALSGLPLGLTEPYFGTSIGAGVRLAFNQFFPISALWAQLAHVDRVELTATGTRSMIAVWAILASYMLGKGAGGGNRRVGLLTALVQVLIYLASPFFRGDNVSSFFFERINTDKFTVPVVMLPVIFALTIRFLREGHRQAWIAAALATGAVSAVHPLIAAMLALGLSAFGGLHLLLRVRNRIALKRTIAVGVLVVIVMILPFIQFLIARVETPFAPTFPSSFEGWSIGEKMSPALPFVLVRSLDQYGPLPTLDGVDASQANTEASPFLIWRFATNMRQQRVILFSLNRYILDPSYILEPPYLLALLILPFLLRRLRSSLGVQYVLSNTLAVILIMYNPILTPKIGSLMVPWIMWRTIWLLPCALTIALGAHGLLEALGRGLARLLGSVRGAKAIPATLPLALILVAGWLLWPSIAGNAAGLRERTSTARIYPTPERLMARLEAETERSGPAVVVADQALSVTIAAYVAKANILAHRSLTTSEVFPADQQDVALQRLIDQNRFYKMQYLTDTSIDILRRYNARYVVTASGSKLDLQLRLAPKWFEWLMDDESYGLFAVRELPAVNHTIQGNNAMQEAEWQAAQEHYRVALEEEPSDLLALFGLAESYRILGQFDLALETLGRARAFTDSIVLHYELSRLYAETGDIERSIAELEQIQAAAPLVGRFHMAMGDVCLGDGRIECATDQYRAAVLTQSLPDEPSRLIAEADIWLEGGRKDLALSLYEKAAELGPSKSNRLLLANVYQDLGKFDQAEALLSALQRQAPTDFDVVAEMGDLAASRGETDLAVTLFNRAIWLQQLEVRDTSATHLALAQVLLAADRHQEARREIEEVLNLQPYSASAYTLMGNLYRDQQQPELAVSAYQEALKLNPTQVVAYISLTDQFRQQADSPADVVGILESGTQANPEQVALFLSLGNQLRQRGDAKSTIAAYQLVLESLEPHQVGSGVRQRTGAHNRAKAYTSLAAVYEDQGDLNTAMNYYHAAAAAAPTEPQARVLLGDALRRRHDMAGAEAAYRQSIKTDPGYVDAYLHLAELLRSQGKTGEVQALYDQALQAALAQQDRGEQAKIWLGLGNRYLDSRRPRLQPGSDEVLAVAGGSPDPDTESALNAYSQAVQADESLATINALAQLYQQIGQTERAIELFHEEINKGESESWAPALLSQYYVSLGSLYQAADQADMAVTAYEQAVSLDGWSAPARVGLARALSEQGDEEAALSQFRKAVEAAPGSVDAQLALAGALDERGNKEEALGIYQAMVQAHPGNVQADLALAGAWEKRYQWAAAEQSYRQAIAMVPGNAQSFVGLAGLYTTLARHQEAETLLRQAIDLDHSYTPAYASLGDLLARQGNHAEGVTAYEQAIQIAPSDWRLYSGLAEVQHALGQTNQAINNLQKAASANGRSPEPLLRLAAVYQEQDQIDRAEQVLFQALLRPQVDADTRAALAKLYQAQGLTDEALIQLRSAARENPESVEALVAYADELRRRGRDDEAEPLYQQAESSAGITSAGYRALALARDEEGRPDEAMALIGRAIELTPEEPANWIAKGQLLARQGEREAALTAFQQATATAFGQGQPWQALGDALLDGGQMEQAIQAFNQAIVAEPTYLPSYESLVRAYQLLGQADQVTQTLEAARQAVPGSYVPYLYTASYLESQMKWNEAQATLAEAVDKAPGVLDSYLLLGDLLARRGRYPEAIATYEQAQQAGLAHWRLYSALSEAYSSEGQFDLAAANLQKAAVTATSPDPLIRLAAIYRERNQPDQAERALQGGLDRFPGSVVVRSSLAQLYQSQGMSQDAVAQLRLAVEESAGSIEALAAYAEAQRLQDRADEARVLYQQAEQLGVHRPTDYRSLAHALQAQGRLADALALIDQAIAAAPNEPTNWMEKGQLETGLRDVEAALASFQQATRLAPGEGRTWHALGKALVAEDRTELGVVALNMAISVEPSYLPPYASLYEAYRALGQEIQATHIMTLAQQLVPGSYLGDLYAARALQEEQRWDQARAVLEQAIAKAPGMPEPLIALGQLEGLQGNVEQAIAAYDRAIALRPGEGVAQTGLADLLLVRGYNNQALSGVQQALTNRPGDGELLLRLGRTQQALGHLVEAESAFLKAADLNLHDGRAQAELAELYLAQGQPQKAIAAYQQALGLQPDQSSYYLALAQIRSSQGETDAALAMLREGLLRASRPASLYAALSSLYQRQGQPIQALQTLQQGIGQLGDEIELLVALGTYYGSRAEFDQAEQAYLRAVTLHPGESAGHTALGDLYVSRGRVTEAMAEFQKAVDLEANRPAVYLALGDSQSQTGHLGDATTTYSQALALAPTQPDIYADLASAYQEQGRIDEAKAVYEKGLLMVPSSAQLMIQYATLLVQQGETDRALALSDQAVQLAPNGETLITRAQLYRQLSRLDDALRDLQAALEIEPGSADALITLGNLYQARGEVASARTAYQQAIALAPGVAEGYVGLANLANSQGRLDEADRYYQAARVAEPASADVMLHLAGAHLGRGDRADAEAAYRQATVLAPLSVEAYVGLATLEQQRSGDLNRSLALLRQAQNLGVEQGLAYRAIGDLYVAAAQSSKAPYYYRLAIRHDPASPEGFLALSGYYLAAGLPHEAEVYAQQALQVSPRNPAAYIALGNIYQSRGDVARAERDYRAAINQAPTEASGYAALAAMQAAKQQAEQAVAAYRQAIRVAPLDASLWVALGHVYKQAGQYKNAYAAFDRAAAINSSLPDPWLAKGDTYQLQGNTSAAQGAYERAQRLRPQDPVPLLRLASLAVDQGDYDTAERYARQAVKVDQTSATAHAMLATALAGKGLRDEAITSYTTAIQLDPRQMSAYTGWIRQHLGDEVRHPNTARLQKALAAVASGRESGSLWSQTLLGLGYGTLEGATRQAISFLQSASAMDPVFADLYPPLATAYEKQLNGRLALATWYRYLYATSLTAATTTAQAHIDWLLKGRIEKPGDGARVPGGIDIIGTAAREKFAYYRLEYRAPGSDTWSQIGDLVYQPVTHGLLATWHTAGLPPGEYKLRLSVVDNTGNYGPYDEITVEIQ